MASTTKWKSYYAGTIVDPCNATPVEIWSVDNHHWSISVHFLGSRSWMTRLTLAPEGSGSLAKLQPLHKLLQLRSRCNRGYMCRMLKNKRWEVVLFCVRCIWSQYLTTETHYQILCVSLLVSEVEDYSLCGYCYSLKKEGTVGEWGYCGDEASWTMFSPKMVVSDM